MPGSMCRVGPELKRVFEVGIDRETRSGHGDTQDNLGQLHVVQVNIITAELTVAVLLRRSMVQSAPDLA